MYQAPRGTSDILPSTQNYWQFVRDTVERCSDLFGYSRIDTPAFEDTRLFLRTVGSETDIVQKEMYSFMDRGGQDLTLRPEGTAAVCRAYIEHGMSNEPQPVRLYYISPMFRYDRPQAGRYRQHHQFGVEAIGDSDPVVDAEIIQLAVHAVSSLGLSGVELVLNTIGDLSGRPMYLQALHDYYTPFKDSLCDDCVRRHLEHPLRLLDCKNHKCQQFLESAPKSSDFLGKEAQEHWNSLLRYLDGAGVPYRLDHRLVRGLDYYSRTVFELQPAEEGAQSSIAAGGRYDGLIQQLGGQSVPGIGFAMGLERVIKNLEEQRVNVPDLGIPPVVVVHNSPDAKQEAFLLTARLRKLGIKLVIAPTRSLRAQMRFASSLNAPHVLIIGPDELEKQIVTVRDMHKQQQSSVPEERVPELVNNFSD